MPPGKPLFESIVTVQNLPFADSLQRQGDRLGVESARWIERTNYPLAVTAVPGKELAIRITFDSGWFLPHSVEGSRSPSNPARGDGGRCERRLIDLPWITDVEQDLLVGQSDRTRGQQVLDDIEIDQSAEPSIDALIPGLG